MKKQLLAFVLASLCFVGIAHTETVTAQQGAPGRTGWPTTTTACALLLPDAGSPYASTTGGAASVLVPPAAGGGNGPNPNRQYIVVCNSLQNTTQLLKCRSDGTVPVMAVTNPGDVLGVGDCIVYSAPKGTAQPVNCIASAATTYITSYECM